MNANVTSESLSATERVRMFVLTNGERPVYAFLEDEADDSFFVFSPVVLTLSPEKDVVCVPITPVPTGVRLMKSATQWVITPPPTHLWAYCQHLVDKVDETPSVVGPDAYTDLERFLVSSPELSQVLDNVKSYPTLTNAPKLQAVVLRKDDDDDPPSPTVAPIHRPTKH